MFPEWMKETIQEILGRCRRRYPDIDLPPELLCRRLEEIRADSGADATSWLQLVERLHLEDLFLATACSAGDPTAWRVFAGEHLQELKRSAVFACRNREDGEDLAQEIFTSLLDCAAAAGGDDTLLDGSGKSRHTTGLAGYNGRGSLKSWLRVSAAHAAIDRFRKSKREVPLGDDADPGPKDLKPAGPAAGPEPLDDHWGRLLGAAVASEIGKLPPADRLMLGLYYVEGLSLQCIGRRCGFHEATASRRLDRLRRIIRKGVEKSLGRQHGLKGREILGLWKSAVDNGRFSLREVLAHPAERTDSGENRTQGGRFLASNKMRIRR